MNLPAQTLPKPVETHGLCLQLTNEGEVAFQHQGQFCLDLFVDPQTLQSARLVSPIHRSVDGAAALQATLNNSEAVVTLVRTTLATFADRAPNAGELAPEENLLERTSELLQSDFACHPEAYLDRPVAVADSLSRLVHRDFEEHPEEYFRAPLELAEAALFPARSYHQLSQAQRNVSVDLGRQILQEIRARGDLAVFALMGMDERRRIVETALSRVSAGVLQAA